MINKIKRLKSIGKFYDFSASGDGLGWNKNTLLYAPNAYGKSTVVDVLRSLRDNNPNLVRARQTLGSPTPPEAVIIVDGTNHVFNGTTWDKSYPTLNIFDVPFIQANILSNEIEYEHRKNIHRIIIGAKGIKLVEELSGAKARERSKRQALEALRSSFNQGGFKHHTLEAFLMIPSTEESAVAARIDELSKKIKSKETESQVRTLELSSELAAPSLDLSKARMLIGQVPPAAPETAEKYIQAQIEKNIADEDVAKDFIKQGLDLIKADCPFCGQDLKKAEALLEAYRISFGDVFRAFQADIVSVKSSIDNWNLENELTALLSSHNKNVAAVSSWLAFLGPVGFPDASTFIEKARRSAVGSRAGVVADLDSVPEIG